MGEKLTRLVQATRHLGLELVISLDRDNPGYYLFNLLDPKRGVVVMYGVAPTLRVVVMYCEHYINQRLKGGKACTE